MKTIKILSVCIAMALVQFNRQIKVYNLNELYELHAKKFHRIKPFVKYP